MTARSEQETVMRWAADEDVVEVYTAYAPSAAKLKRAGLKPYKTTTRTGEGEDGWFFRVPLDLFGWRIKRPLSDERRKSLSENARRICFKRSSSTKSVRPTEEVAKDGPGVDPD